MANWTNRGTRGIAIGALLLLSLIWAFGSLRADLLPRSAVRMSVTPLVMEALLLAIFTAVAGTIALFRKAPWPRGPFLVSTLLTGLGLFVVPALLDELGKKWIDDSTRVALFSLTPLFAVVFEPHLGKASTPEMRGSFAAALVAVLGTFLVFPVDVPRSIASGFAFFAVVISAISVAAANCLAVRLASDEQAKSLLSFAAIATAGATLCLAAIGSFLGHRHDSAVPFDAWAAPDLVALALLFWLMPRMSAVRMTVRFLLAPLIANLIGLAYLRPHVQLQSWIGLMLIATGSSWLLFAPEGQPVPTGSSLDIR